MAATDLKALRFPFKDPKFIFFTDFDGTITLKDSNDFMVSVIIDVSRTKGNIELNDHNRQTPLAMEPRSVRLATKMFSKARRLSGKPHHN
jgi:2-hydroxy-3-keto-5-methylthiopentenyl-1-phosphate phosphatase